MKPFIFFCSCILLQACASLDPVIQIKNGQSEKAILDVEFTEVRVRDTALLIVMSLRKELLEQASQTLATTEELRPGVDWEKLAYRNAQKEGAVVNLRLRDVTLRQVFDEMEAQGGWEWHVDKPGIIFSLRGPEPARRRMFSRW